jgi:hypothetical protein
MVLAPQRTTLVRMTLQTMGFIEMIPLSMNSMKTTLLLMNSMKTTLLLTNSTKTTFLPVTLVLEALLLIQTKKTLLSIPMKNPLPVTTRMTLMSPWKV